MPDLKIREKRGGAIAREFTPQEREELFNLTKSRAWDLLLDILEGECVAQDTNFINVDAADEKKIIAEHNMAKAMWLFYTRFQKRVAKEIQAIQLPLPAPTLESKEQQFVAETMDPTTIPQ